MVHILHVYKIRYFPTWRIDASNDWEEQSLPKCSNGDEILNMMVKIWWTHNGCPDVFDNRATARLCRKMCKNSDEA